MKHIIRRNSEPNSGNWERDTLEKLLLEAYREQRRARIWKLIFRLLLIAFLALYLFAIFGNIGSLNPAAAGPHTAVIRLEGAITAGENQAGKLRQGLEAAYKNKQVRGIIIRANTPAFAGGELIGYRAGNPAVLGYTRSNAEQTVLVLANYSEFEQHCPAQVFQAMPDHPVRDLLTDRDRLEELSAAGARSSAQYDWEVVADKVFEVYKLAIAMGSPAESGTRRARDLIRGRGEEGEELA